MGNTLKPGMMGIGLDDMDNSMGKDIDDEHNNLLIADGITPLDTDMSVADNRSRRRLFVAIARGVVKHLEANPDAFNFETRTGVPLIPRKIDGTGV